MKFINNLYAFLWTVVNPTFWIMSSPYSEIWEEEFLELINNGTIDSVTPYTVTIDKIKIWRENYPYACFTPDDPELRVRPSRRNIYWANKVLARRLIIYKKCQNLR